MKSESSKNISLTVHQVLPMLLWEVTLEEEIIINSYFLVFKSGDLKDLMLKIDIINIIFFLAVNKLYTTQLIMLVLMECLNILWIHPYQYKMEIY